MSFYPAFRNQRYSKGMQILLEISDRVVARAQEKGLEIEAYVRQVLADVGEKDSVEWTPFGPGPYTPQEAGQNIRELRKKNILGGLKIKDLIHEGHKY